MSPSDEQTPLDPLDDGNPAMDDAAAGAAASTAVDDAAAGAAASTAVDGAAADGAATAPPAPLTEPPPPAQQPPPPPPPAYQPVAEPLGYRPPVQPLGQPATGATGEPLASPGAYPWQDYIGVGKRFVAIFIDLILVSVVAGIIAVAAGLDSDVENVNTTLYLITFVIMVGYHTVLEGSRGATLGKMALGIKVTMEDGSPLTWGAALVRNLLRIVDGIFSYLVGAVLVWNSPKRQRLGDRVAKTVVVRAR